MGVPLAWLQVQAHMQQLRWLPQCYHLSPSAIHSKLISRTTGPAPINAVSAEEGRTMMSGLWKTASTEKDHVGALRTFSFPATAVAPGALQSPVVSLLEPTLAPGAL